MDNVICLELGFAKDLTLRMVTGMAHGRHLVVFVLRMSM